jgi:dienelactone hydrolase
MTTMHTPPPFRLTLILPLALCVVGCPRSRDEAPRDGHAVTEGAKAPSSAAPNASVNTPAQSAPAPGGAQRVELPSRDADLAGGKPTTIAALVFKPASGTAAPLPAVVLLHGCSGLFKPDGSVQPRDLEWAHDLRDAGFVVMLPDSFNPRGMRSVCSHKISDRTIRPGYERARDVYASLEWLQATGYVDNTRIFLLGWSNGGGTVLAAVARTSHARPKGLAVDFKHAFAFYPPCRASNERDEWQPVVPLSIFIGEADDWTPAAPCKDLDERAKASKWPVELVVYPGAYHDFDAPNVPVQVRRDVGSTASGTAHIGTDPAARADSKRRVMEQLRAK